MTPTPFDWHAHPEAWLLTGGLLFAYFGLLRRYGPVFHPRPDDPAASRRQKMAFVAGVFVLWLASATPLHDLAERYLFSAHMIQHMLEVYIAPPLLLVGIPGWMGQMLLKPRWLRAAVTRASRWLPAAIIFNVALMVLHVPAMVALQVRNDGAHALIHIVLISTALLMWMPVFSPVPEIRRLPIPGQLIYLFLQTLTPTIPATFLTFGDAPLYHVYEPFPRVWEWLTPLQDMRIAGLMMKIGGGFFIWILITVLFFRWSAQEERNPGSGERRLDQPVAPPTVPPTLTSAGS